MSTPLQHQTTGVRAPGLEKARGNAIEVQRYTWDSQFGQVFIEVIDGVVYVNGDRVDSFKQVGDCQHSVKE